MFKGLFWGVWGSGCYSHTCVLTDAVYVETPHPSVSRLPKIEGHVQKCGLQPTAHDVFRQSVSVTHIHVCRLTPKFQLMSPRCPHHNQGYDQAGGHTVGSGLEAESS